MSNEFFTAIKRVPLTDTMGLLPAARLNTFWSRRAQLRRGSTAWLQSSTTSVTQKCPQVVGSVKWQIRDSTTNFFTLILLREQQLSTVTISAQGRRDKRGAANGRGTTLFTHTLNWLPWKTQCTSHPLLPFWRKRTALNCTGVTCRDARGSWRAGAWALQSRWLLITAVALNFVSQPQISFGLWPLHVHSSPRPGCPRMQSFPPE